MLQVSTSMLLASCKNGRRTATSSSPERKSTQVTAFSDSAYCNKRASSAPIYTQVLRNPPCRVLSSRKRSLSVPLRNFMYDITEKAFSNSKGYTWTPMYLQHCGRPRIFNRDCIKESPERKLSSPPVVMDTSWNLDRSWNLDQKVRDQEPHRIWEVKQYTSYSKFMESPYLSRKLHSKWREPLCQQY